MSFSLRALVFQFGLKFRATLRNYDLCSNFRQLESEYRVPTLALIFPVFLAGNPRGFKFLVIASDEDVLRFLCQELCSVYNA